MVLVCSRHRLIDLAVSKLVSSERLQATVEDAARRAAAAQVCTGHNGTLHMSVISYGVWSGSLSPRDTVRGLRMVVRFS